MVLYGGDKVSFFLIGGREVVGRLTDFDDRREARTEESHGLGAGWAETAFVGVREGEITQQGFYDDAVGSVHEALSTAGATAVLSYCLEGTATGVNFVGWRGALQVNYERQQERDALTKARATYRTGEGAAVEQGKVIRTWKKWAATGNTTANMVDCVACSTAGGVGYLQHQAASGEAIIRLLHSEDGNAWDTLLEFTKLTSGYGAQAVPFAGSVNQYIAADYTTATATGKVGALTAMVGLVRNIP